MCSTLLVRRRPPRGHWLALAAGAVVACTPPPPADPLRLETEALGLSGLALGPDGSLWAICEECRELLRIDRDTGAVTAHLVEGIPPGLEAEALSYRADGRFVVGTETAEDSRTHDDLFVLTFDGQVARVAERHECRYDLWGIDGAGNRGIEGLCSVGDGVVVAAEVTALHDGRRYAPLAWRAANGHWGAYRVTLSSPTGKLAGIDCRPRPDGGADVLAIERHFGVTHILGFRLPPPVEGEPVTVEPHVHRDLDEWVRSLELQPNFEGIVWLEGNRVALLVDNQYRGRRTGPSELWFVELDP